VAFDAHPLTEPVDPRAVSAFAAELRARQTSSSNVSTIIGLVIAGIAVLTVVPIVVVVAGLLATTDRGGLALIPLVLILAVGIGIGLIAWFSVRARRITRYRLSRFAAANNMTYEGQISNPSLPGMIFSSGSARMSTDLVRGHSPRFVEFGNYQYTVKSGKNSTTYRWGYVAVKLDVPLPNIVLDALGNNSVFGSNLPASFRKEQRLSLEGDFDQYFTLYCPEGYERDALYLFTPDIMARFIDNAAQLDVEIVDDWLFLYTRRQVSTLDPATWAWLFGTVGALITKFDQWARWRDERLLLEQGQSGAVAATGSADSEGSHALPFAAPAGMLTPPPGVAREGRRLKRGFRWLPIVFMVVVGILWFWMQLD
jgi:hypothetical protein